MTKKNYIQIAKILNKQYIQKDNLIDDVKKRLVIHDIMHDLRIMFKDDNSNFDFTKFYDAVTNQAKD